MMQMIKVGSKEKVALLLALTRALNPAFQLTDGNSVLQSEGVPFIFNKFTYLGPGSEYETDKHLAIPRDHSIPGNNDVVEIAP
jgi:hypothetical protein